MYKLLCVEVVHTRTCVRGGLRFFLSVIKRWRRCPKGYIINIHRRQVCNFWIWYHLETHFIIFRNRYHLGKTSSAFALLFPKEEFSNTEKYVVPFKNFQIIVLNKENNLRVFLGINDSFSSLYFDHHIELFNDTFIKLDSCII